MLCRKIPRKGVRGEGGGRNNSQVKVIADNYILFMKNSCHNRESQAHVVLRTLK